MRRLDQSVLADLRYAARTLHRSPAFAAGAILTLALGIGANVAVFAFVNSLLRQPLPYHEPDRLVAVADTFPNEPGVPMPVSYPNFADWRARQHAFSAAAVYRETPLALGGSNGQAERVVGVLATADLFRALGTPPVAGRAFRADEDRPGGSPVVVIGYNLWQRRFAGQPVVGRSLTVDSLPRTIVGVMAPGFAFPDSAELWIPAAVDASVFPRGRHAFECVARLKAGVTAAAAGVEMSALARDLARQHPGDNEGVETIVQPLRGSLVPAKAGFGFSLLMGAVGFVLLIACANLANLMLSRAAARNHELAVRAALGASRGRLVRQLLTESWLLAAAGAGLGLAVGAAGRDALVALVPVPLPSWLRFEIDGTVIAFALLLAALATAVFGLVPAVRSAGPAVASGFGAPRAGVSGSRDRLRGALIASEVAFAAVLLIGGGLMLRALAGVLAVDPGVRAANVWSGRLSLPAATYPTADAQRAFFAALLEQVRALPGVRTASAISSLPMDGAYTMRGVTVEGRPPRAAGEELLAITCATWPGYFETLGIRLVRGRTFHGTDDRPGRLPTTIVNEAFVKRFLPPGDPIGRRVTLGEGDEGEPWMTIVGVVADVRHASLDTAPEPALFTPYGQRPSPSMTLVVSADAAPLSLSEPIRRIVSRLDPDRPVFAVRTMEQVMARSVWQSRFFTWLVALFGGVALVLASVGVYSIISCSVARRSAEIGVRLALGARRWHIRWLVMRHGLLPTLLGLAAGLAAAALVGRVLGAWLHGVSPTDPATYAVVSLVLVLSAAGACALPSARAARLDPMTTLRGQ